MLTRIPAARFLLLLLVGSLLVRLAAVLALRDPTQFHGFEMGQDGVHYDEMARSLAAAQGFVIDGQPTAFRPPGFPLFLAGVYALSAQSYLAAYLALCLLGSLAVYWTYRAGCLLADERTGRIAAVLLALYPPHIYFATLFASENLFITLLALALFLGAQSELRRGTLLAGLGLGLCLGFLILTRPFAILALPLLFLPLLLWRTQRGRVQLLRAAGLGAGVALCLIPWGLRNQAQLGEFVLLSTGGGPTFRGSYNDRVLEEKRFHGGWVAADQLPDWERLRAVPSELERNRLQMQWGREWLHAHWQDLPRMLWWRFARFWMPDRDSENRSYVLLQWAGTSPFLILIGVGIVWRMRQRPYGRQWWLADSLMLACLATGLMFWGAPRFRDGNAPILMLYAALPLAALFRRFSPPDSDGEPGASSSASTRAGSARVPPP